MKGLVTCGEAYGNLVMATPAIAAAAQLCCGPVDVLLTHGPLDMGELLRGWDAVRTVARTAHELPESRYDVLVSTRWANGAAVAADRVGNWNRSLPRFDTHEVEVNMTAVRAVGFAGATPAPNVEHDEPLSRGYVVLANGYRHSDRGWARKAWPRMGDLAKALLRQGRRIVVLGSREDYETWMAGFDARLGTQDIRGAATIIAGAAVVVAVDNGLGHIAAAVGTPLVSIFGGTSERKNLPVGDNVHLVTADVPCRPCQGGPEWGACAEYRCTNNITVDHVLAAVHEEIGR